VSIEFHVTIFDENRARKERRWGEIGFSFTGMTEPQRALIITLLRRTAVKLEEQAPIEEVAMSLRKTGSGQVLGEDKSHQKIASGPSSPWTPKDSDELAAEMTEDERTAGNGQ
jgi:hypothetical protein